ncbi:hypothetical protein [Streptomyces sp. SHP 1-2]|uniref:hypothetical protein n=1 Tax=Streptomyces sp. SHP 1-2 TaxID=2769489 RepID=UPI0022372421|nr:hypothetical protein [Streptomyces sp. SHP 1-2]MCW5253314.1 hypothetical protein [Streptomyces sp. SHP 1-2]
MKHRIPRLLFVALCGAAPAVLGGLLHWSAWLWGFMCMVTASGSLLLAMTVLSRNPATADPYEPTEPEPPTAPVERPYEETRVVDATVPSATEGYDFLFSATVWWKPIPDHADWSTGATPALAVSSVVSRAVGIVQHEQPDRANFARYLLEGELSSPLPDRSGRVRALAVDVTLTLAPADRERLRRRNELRKDEELWEHERQHERNKRRYLGDDVLKSAGSAVVWWLARHEDDIEKAVSMIGPLAQIAAAARDEEVPEIFRHLLVPPAHPGNRATAEGPLWNGTGHEEGPFDREEEGGVTEGLLLLMAAAGLKPDTDEYTVLVHRFTRALEAAGLPEAAEEIRRDLLRTADKNDEPEDEPTDGPTGGEGPSVPWSPHSPSPGRPPFSEGGTSPTGGWGSHTGQQDQDRGASSEGEGEGEGERVSPHFWDASHSPHRPTAPRTRDEGDGHH